MAAANGICELGQAETAKRRAHDWGLSAESCLLFDLISPEVDDTVRQRVAAAPASGVDWQSLLDRASRFRVVPLLHRGVADNWSTLVPDEICKVLKSLVRQNTLRNMMLVSQCVRAHRVLGDAGISTIAYKGPTLAQRLYGAPGLRLYGDLDLLVPPSDVPRALKAMVAAGYEPVQGLDTYMAHRYLATKREARMLAPRTKTLVEVQWRIAAHWEIPLGAAGLEEMWQRVVPISLAGQELGVFCPEDLFVVLSAHAACHCFQWPSSICDIAEIMRVYSDLDWRLIVRSAEKLRVRRMVFLAVYLCHALLGMPVPDRLADAIRQDQIALDRLGQMTCRALESNQALTGNLWHEARMHIGLRQSYVDKVRFAGHYAAAYVMGILGRGASPEDGRP